MSVEKEKDSVDAFSKPLEDPDEVVAAVDPLFLAAQNSGRVDDGDA